VGLQVFDGLADLRLTFEEFAALARPTRGRPSFRSDPALDRRRVRPIQTVNLPVLPPRGMADVEVELVPLRRGVLHFNSVALARPDPFVLFRSFSCVKRPGALTILPKRYALPPFALPGSQQYQHGGVALAASIGESEEFVSLRDYRPGDPMRRIHWRSWAKAGRPIVKEFQDEFFVRHALILDTFIGGTARAASGSPRSARRTTSRVASDAAFEEAVSVAASFACTIDTQESLLDLLFIGPEAFCFTIGRGVAHADQMMEILASVQPTPNGSFAALEQLVIEHAESVSGCICIFLEWDDARRELVRKLSALGVPAMVLVIRDKSAPGFERRASDPESLHMLGVGNIAADLAKI
jgi:uncharacterized protein (DUF58 family)